MPSYRRGAAVLACLLAGAVVAVYARVTTLGVVIDDGLFLNDNPYVRQGLTVEGIRWAFSNSVAGLWHPLTLLSYMLEVRLFGASAAVHHAVNALLHLLNTLLLFAVLRRMSGRTLTSAAVAALFAVHPLHVESVAWIAERKDVLSTFFGLLALGAWQRYAERPGAARYAAVAALFVLGLAAKPMLVTLPFLILLLDYWPLGRGVGRRVLLEKAPLLAVSAVASAVAYLTQSSHGAMSMAGAYPLGARAANAAVAYLAYIAKTVWPVGLAAMYPHPGAGLPHWRGIAAAGFHALVLALAWRSRRRFPWHLTGLLWFYGTLVPVIGIVQIGEQAYADRYTYVPLIGLSIAASWGLASLATRLGTQRTLAAATLAALAAFGLLAFLQVGYWRDVRALYQRAVDAAPGSWMMHGNLAAVLLQDGEVESAVQQYREVVRLKPSLAEARSNLALALQRRGHLEEAAREYREALRLKPLHPTADGGLGAVLLRLGKYGEAVPHLERSVRIRPDRVDTRVSLGLALYSSGRAAEALLAFQAAASLAPARADIRNYLGASLESLGRPAEALAALREAVRLEPTNAFYRSRVEMLQAAVGRGEPGP